MSKKCILVTGGFDPIHLGHITLMKAAKNICNFLVVGINSDEWLVKKKGTNFYDLKERFSIIQEFEFVDKVISFNDDDGSASNAILECLNFSEHVIFANGGDRNDINIPEVELFKNNNRVEFIYDVGGSKKINSSSSILNKYYAKSLNIANSSHNEHSYQDVEDIFYNKPWGKYRILSTGDGYKVKEILVEPGMKLSLQFHYKRSEHWIIASGFAEVCLEGNVSKHAKGDHVYIEVGQEHRIHNVGDNTLMLIEVALGSYIEEDDIVRVSDIYGRK